METKEMGIYEELVARGLIAQLTNEAKVRSLINNGKATFVIGLDPTTDSLHIGHFMALCLMKILQMVGNKPIALIGGGIPYSNSWLISRPNVKNNNCFSVKQQHMLRL